jgi:two-component system, OmpR family, response regulator
MDKIKLFLVDDDAVFLKLAEINLQQHADFEIETFSTGELCIKNLNHEPDLIILDYELNGFNKYAMNGLLTLDKIKMFNPDIPVIMLSAQDKIEVAVNCMRHHAYSYLVKKDTTFVHLQKVITEIFSFSKMEKKLIWYD